MRKVASRLLGALVLLSVIIPAPVRSSVILSELCDPRLNYATDRFIEIYNAGADPVDLTGWSLVAIANSVEAHTWALSGSIAPGQALVAGNSTTVTVFPVAFPSATWSGGNVNWNGKVGDGAKLLNGSGTVTDYVVATGTAFENADYVRKPAIVEPSTTYDPAQWTSTAVDLATGASPGSHLGVAPAAGPVISGVVTLPAVPLATDTVHVRASVVDTNSTITSVSLLWGTVSTSLANVIPMALVSGDTYGTTAAIPAQPAGTTVYCKVQAANAAPATTTSGISSYFLSYTLTIHQIEGEAAASPYAGMGVITSGVVTAACASCFAMQDGAGAWDGLWVRSTAPPAIGDVITVRGTVSETDASGFAGTTLLTGATVTIDSHGAPLPTPVAAGSAAAVAEAYEGVLVKVAGATCTRTNVRPGEWLVDDGSGPARVGLLGCAFVPTLGTAYDVTGPVAYADTCFKLEPRSGGDIVWAGDVSPPVVLAVGQMSDSTFLVTFSELVESVSAGAADHYAIAGNTAVAAAWDPLRTSQVLVTVPGVPAGDDTLWVTGVADLYGNATPGTSQVFPFIDIRIPPGYYDSALGLRGTALRAALHAIIKNHTAKSYDYAWTAYRTSDVKPNGRVWDVYSDTPGGTPPYEYTFEQTGGVGGREGGGYTREHTWCKSWFGGEVAPMYSELWILYPCDADVNGNRGVNPYGETSAPSYTSLNGSKRGPSSDPGYSGLVFEPIAAFKGDLARSYFYVSTRYYTEDAAWPGGPATDKADLLPWANAMYVRWSHADPVSQKEVLRNGAIYAIQHNRNPFIDHPEFVDLLFDSTSAAGIEGGQVSATRLHANAPNPFRPSTSIRFDLARRERVALDVYDVSGRRVRALVGGQAMEAGRHEMAWDGRTESGQLAGPGLYFCRFAAGTYRQTIRMALVR